MIKFTWYHGYYWGIPVWIAEHSDESMSLEGKNWFSNKFIDVLIWIDCNLFGYFPAVISDVEAPEHIQDRLNNKYA